MLKYVVCLMKFIFSHVFYRQKIIDPAYGHQTPPSRSSWFLLHQFRRAKGPTIGKESEVSGEISQGGNPNDFRAKKKSSSIFPIEPNPLTFYPLSWSICRKNPSPTSKNPKKHLPTRRENCESECPLTTNKDIFVF